MAKIVQILTRPSPEYRQDVADAQVRDLDSIIQKLNTTYQQELKDEVCKLANGLKEIGVQKGDRVTIYMPMVPQAVYSMLACARIGAVHSVVFGGFSADSLAGRIIDCKSEFVITADHTNISFDKKYKTSIGIFRVPIIFFDPSENKKTPYKSQNIIQHIDILPSILSYIGYNKPFISFGNNLLVFFAITKASFTFIFFKRSLVSFQPTEAMFGFISFAASK